MSIDATIVVGYETGEGYEARITSLATFEMRDLGGDFDQWRARNAETRENVYFYPSPYTDDRVYRDAYGQLIQRFNLMELVVALAHDHGYRRIPPVILALTAYAHAANNGEWPEGLSAYIYQH